MSPTTDKPLVLYVRVSAKGDRSEETFHSPREQAERARAHAEAKGYAVLEPAIEDIDVSGGTHPEQRPGMAQALELVRSDQAGGIVAGWLDRLTRDPAHGDWLVSEVTTHGAVIAAPDLPEDIESPTGEFSFSVLLATARLYRRQAGARFESAKARSIAAGIPVGPVPVGYRRRADRTIELDPELAPVVREMFERRAQGARWPELLAVLEPATGRTWSKQAVASMIPNRFYVGELRYGDLLGPSHEAIVDEALFAAANRPELKPRDSRSKNGMPWLLTGLAHCAFCENRIQPWTGNRKKDGTRIRRYRCNTRWCEHRGLSISADLLERHVVSTVFQLLGTKWEERAITVDLEPLVTALETAARRLEQVLAPEARDALGDLWATDVKARREEHEAAALALGKARAKAGLEDGPVVDLAAEWDELDAVARREALARYAVTRVIVSGKTTADVEIELR